MRAASRRPAHHAARTSSSVLQAGPDATVLVDLYADCDSYQSWTDREIPVVVLSPR